MRRFSLLAALFLCACLRTFPARAQQSGEVNGSAGGDTVLSISRDLVCPCPDCGGKALDLCESTCRLGQQRRDVVAKLLSQGLHRPQIMQQMAATYGPAILGEPPREGWGILSLAIPLACLAGGGLPLWWFTRGRSTAAISRSPRAASTSTRANATEDAQVAAALRDFDY